MFQFDPITLVCNQNVKTHMHDGSRRKVFKKDVTYTCERATSTMLIVEDETGEDHFLSRNFVEVCFNTDDEVSSIFDELANETSYPVPNDSSNDSDDSDDEEEEEDDDDQTKYLGQLSSNEKPAFIA